MFKRLKYFIYMCSQMGKVTDISVYGMDSAHMKVKVDGGEIEFSMNFTADNNEEETDETV